MITDKQTIDVSKLKYVVNQQTQHTKMAIQDIILAQIEKTPEFSALYQAIGISNGITMKAFLDVIRGAINIRYEQINMNGVGQVRVSFKRRILKDGLANALPSIIWAQVRRRNPTNEPELAFISDIVDGQDDITAIFAVNWAIQQGDGSTFYHSGVDRQRPGIYLHQIIKTSPESISEALIASVKESD
jgi:hypothetical protein